ncbi:hypothetical protein JL720_10843 [Aureococcus anophagefferens]|nr:hypothetical protein JL720_10843 [Aureococcus anophagefferens]
MADKSQSEFAQLQREYRHMELNRKSYADESYSVLRKQQATIAKLRKDNEALKQELGMETRHSTLKPNESTEKNARLQEESEKFARLMSDEQKRIEYLDEQISTIKMRTIQQRKTMGGVNAARENQAMVQKQIKILENRLDQALVKFNQALAKNKALREAIDDLRRERVVFDNIYRKLERELHEKKKQMANANRKEQDDFEAQMVELGRVLENELQVPPPTLLGNGAPGTAKSNGGTAGGDPAAADGRGPGGKKSKPKGGGGVSKEKLELQAATGISAIDELVRMFIKNEDQNFSLFNYVNEQTNEIEKLEEQVQALQDEQAKYTQESGDDVNQHKLILLDLESKLATTEANASKYESKCEEYQAVIDSLKKAIASAFTKTQCERASSEIFADSSVTEANMLSYLAIIEEQCNTIIKDYVAVKARQHKQTSAEAADVAGAAPPPSVLGMGPTTPMGQDLIHVNPPKLEDYSSEEEDDDDEGETRPLTRDELKAKTLNRMYRRVQNRGDPALRGTGKYGGSAGATRNSAKKGGGLK